MANKDDSLLNLSSPTIRGKENVEAFNRAYYESRKTRKILKPEFAAEMIMIGVWVSENARQEYGEQIAQLNGIPIAVDGSGKVYFCKCCHKPVTLEESDNERCNQCHGNTFVTDLPMK